MLKSPNKLLLVLFKNISLNIYLSICSIMPVVYLNYHIQHILAIINARGITFFESLSGR